MKGRKGIRTSIPGGDEGSASGEKGKSRRITQRVESRAPDEPAWDGAETTQTSASQPPGSESASRQRPVAAEPVTDPDPAYAAELLLQMAGEEAVASLAENPLLQVPTPENATGSERDGDALPLAQRWLADVLRAFVTRDALAHLQGALQAARAEPQRLQAELERWQSAWDELEASYREKVQGLETELSEANVQHKRVREQLQKTVPVRDLVEQVFEDRGPEAEVRDMLLEALVEPSETLGPFVGAVCIGWAEARAALRREVDDEERRMEDAVQALKRFMARLSGLYIPERREVLKRIGKAVSAGFEEYDFVSPEDWRHVDPAVHNAAGVGGQNVKEGAGFVVQRRSSGQTVIYADIVAE